MQDIQLAIEPGVDLMKDIVAAGYSFLKEKNKERDFFGAAAKKYVGGLLERNSSIKVLTMREPQPLEKLYVRANILKDKITAELGLSAEELEKFHDLDRRAFGKIAETVDGELIVNQLKRFIVLGKPGAGKTTYLRYLTLMMLQPHSQIEQRKLPIFVTLREWADKKKNLMDFIVEQFSICGFEDAQPFVERVLTNGDCIVLFDGLDEVSQEANQSGIIQEIKDFSDKYGENQFVISCRVAAYNRWFERFTDVEMADFNEEQMEKFIQNWFHAEPKVGQECWQKLQNSPQLKELASVPLLLTLICLAYNPEKRDFPQKRSSIYRDAIKVLLEQWDESRPGGRIKRDKIYKNLSRQNKEAMFTRMAWGTFTENQYFIEEEQLGRMIQNFIKNLPEYQDEKAIPDGERILKQIEEQHGILVERAKGVYSFAHLTFQEYFTAKYIVDNAREGTLETLVSEHLYDDKWKEVFLLVAGMLDSADELLLLMQRKNNELLNVQEINALMMAVDKVLLAKRYDFPKTIQRDFVLYLILALDLYHTHALNRSAFGKVRGLNRKRALNQASDLIVLKRYACSSALDLVHARSNALGLDRARSLAIVFEYDHTNFQELTIIITNFFDLDLLGELIKLKQLQMETILKINAFLNAKILILKCLQHDAFVSKPIREKILHEMLMPGKEG